MYEIFVLLNDNGLEFLKNRSVSLMECAWTYIFHANSSKSFSSIKVFSEYFMHRIFYHEYLDRIFVISLIEGKLIQINETIYQ